MSDSSLHPYFAAQPAGDHIARRREELGAWLEIDLDRIAGNLAAIRARTGVEVMPVIKNDAYGHGLVPMAAFLESCGTKWLMVAMTAEALALRRAGIGCNIVNMDALHGPQQHRGIVAADITQVVYRQDQVEQLAAAAEAEDRCAGVFVKVDTGLRRVGVAHEEAVALIETIARSPALQIRGVFSTFMRSPAHDPVLIERFTGVLEALRRKGIDPGHTSMASSNAIFHRSGLPFAMVRPAMALLGIYPEPRDAACGLKLRQALAMFARIEHLKWVEEGQSVTYFGRFVAPSRMQIATLHTGFYDAIPREMANKGLIRIDGTLKRSCGSVSLNHYLFDATGTSARIGQAVEVIGRDGGNDLVQLAREAGWMVYSVLNHLSPFLPRIYLRDGKPIAILERDAG